MKTGDICAFVTDGITEASDEGLRPWRTVARDAARARRQSAETIVKTIMARSQEGHGPDGVDDWTDDRTVIVLTVGDGARAPDDGNS